MKKQYNSKIIQYSISGDVINIFNSPQDAVHIVNYDSIISCCKGKYKTAGGFIWKFEDNKLPNISKNGDIQCKICKSKESVRSMAMHLRWVHNIKTNEYVNEFGEFRPKELESNIRKKESGFECKECGEKLKSNQNLMYHITKFHPEITKHDYIIKHLYNENHPTCKCGCGEEVTILENGKNCDIGKETYSRDYIKGHWDWEVFSTIGKQSKEEIKLVDFIKTIYPGEIQTSVRGIVPKSEIDIYLPELNIGIEYNGLYWHSEKGGRFKEYHLEKLKKANEVNIRLIQIFSDEWLNKNEITKNKLTSIIQPKSNRVYARKCSIKEISSTEKNTFLNKYHIQGEDRSTYKLGIFNLDKLIGVMTFSKPRISLGGNINLKDTYELSRYASSTYIVGGAAKLIKHFKKFINPKLIYSYSDNRWTDPNNNIYLKLGFTHVKTSSPNYFYTKNYLTRIHRYNFNKFKLKKMGADVQNQTEFQIMEGMGYTKIWDCGSSKYELKFS